MMCQILSKKLENVGKLLYWSPKVNFKNTVYAVRNDLFVRYKPTDPHNQVGNWLRTPLEAQTEDTGRKC